jgi:Protein of unknown function (DUF3768)
MNEDIRKARAAIVAELNDKFRTTGQGGTVHLTSGVWYSNTVQLVEIIEMVREYRNFTPQNDPNGEHDFGSFEYDDLLIYWKIDYYDASGEWASDDPANPDKTTRVLTIMLSDEY